MMMTMRVHYELLTNFLRAELCVDHDNSGVQGFPTNVGAPRFSVQHRDGISRALRVLTVLGWSGPSIYKCRMICFKKQPHGPSHHVRVILVAARPLRDIVRCQLCRFDL